MHTKIDCVRAARHGTRWLRDAAGAGRTGGGDSARGQEGAERVRREQQCDGPERLVERWGTFLVYSLGTSWTDGPAFLPKSGVVPGLSFPSAKMFCTST